VFNDQNVFNGAGQLKQFTDSYGNTTQFHWVSGNTNPSPSGRSVTIGTGFTDAIGNKYTKEPLATGGTNDGINGSTIDLNGLKTQMTYDDEARVLTSTEVLTDVNGNVLSENTTSYEYNANSEITKTTDSQGNITNTE
jgi:YD repeat-containing protein